MCAVLSGSADACRLRVRFQGSLHLGAMYTPHLSAVLKVQPASLTHWLMLLGLALTLLVIMEIHKAMRRARP